MFELILKPIVFRSKSDENPRRLAILSNYDLFARGEMQVPGKSFLSSDSATCFIVLTIPFEPCFGFRFRQYRNDLDRNLGYVIEHSNVVANTETILGPGIPAQSLNSALANLGRFVSQVMLNGISHRAADIRLEFSKVSDCLWR